MAPDVAACTAATTVRTRTLSAAVVTTTATLTTRTRTEARAVSATYVKRVDDTLPTFGATLTLNGAAYDLNDPLNGVASAELRYRLRGASTWTTRAVTIHPTTTGLVTYTWQAGEPAEAGVYEYVVTLTYVSADRLSFPNGDGYATFTVTAGSS